MDRIRAFYLQQYFKAICASNLVHLTVTGAFLQAKPLVYGFCVRKGPLRPVNARPKGDLGAMEATGMVFFREGYGGMR
jgi:hypothetical protein